MRRNVSTLIIQNLLIQRDLANSSFGKSVGSCNKGFVNGVDCDFILSHMKTLYRFYIQKLYKMYTADAYTKSILHFGKLLYAFCIQNLYKSLSKCGMHFIYKDFVYKKVSKFGIHFVWKHFVYILHTSILMYEQCTSQALCIQLVYKIYTECIGK